MQRALVAGLSRYARAAGVVLDPRTGAVLALASVPSYDPNGLDARWPALVHDASSPLLDRSTSGLYPPGSTFKIVTASDALDAGVVTPQSTFVDDGGFTVGNFTVHDDEEESTGVQDLAGAFALSSNVDFAQIALKIGVDRWFAYAAKWGLGQPVDFDLPVARDRLPAKSDVFPGVLAQLGFGQASLLVTPMRMALVGATIAHDGTTPRPYLVRRVAGSSTSVSTARRDDRPTDLCGDRARGAQPHDPGRRAGNGDGGAASRGDRGGQDRAPRRTRAGARTHGSSRSRRPRRRASPSRSSSRTSATAARTPRRSPETSCGSR